jgi:hypothetical protein
MESVVSITHTFFPTPLKNATFRKKISNLIKFEVFFYTSYPIVVKKEEISMPRDETTTNRVKSKYWMVTGFTDEPEYDKFAMTCMRVGKEICPKTEVETMTMRVSPKDRPL